INLMEYGLGLVTVIVALILGGVAVFRRDRAARSAQLPAACVVLAVLVLAVLAEAPALSHHAGVTIPLSSLFAVFCLLAAGLTWYAGVAASRASLAARTAGGQPPGRPAGVPAGPDRDYDGDYDDPYPRRDDDSWAGQGWPGPDQTGDFDAYGGLYRDA